MKKLIVFAALVLALAVPLTSSAQTTNNPDSFFNTVEGYFTSFNTNLDTTFATERGSLSVGADYVSGVNVASSFNLEYDLPAHFEVRSTTRNAGIAGVILSEQAGIGYNIVIHDAKLTGFIEGGYALAGSHPYGAIGLEAKKALTTHTFAGVKLETQFWHNVTPPIVSLFTGFVF